MSAQERLNTTPAFAVELVTMQRRMRFNPLRMASPERLSMAHDQFDMGILNQAALLWDAIARRDDTLSFVVPQLENSIAGKPWGVFKRKGADPAEAARHAAALEYFYDNVVATDAFDRNERGDRHLLLKQMSRAYAYRYAVHHFVWRPEPGRTIPVEGAAPAPALSAEMEFVPLWYFENTTGTLRFLPQGGYGVTGQEMNFEGEWMCTTGAGAMFAASACYIFKRLTFQDWTIFNERYAQQKVFAMTPEGPESPQSASLRQIVNDFNGDMGAVLHGVEPGGDLPIKLLGPSGTVSVDLFERFLDRQDRKMTVLFRGSDLRNMSREKDTTGVSAQTQETEALERAHCASIASACRAFIDRAVIRYCFGEGVEPLAYFGLPDMDDDDAGQLRENAGFLADRGVLVDAATIADRLGVTTTEEEEAALGGSKKLEVRSEKSEGRREDGEDLRTGNAAARLDRLIRRALRSQNAGYHPGQLRDGLGQWTKFLAADKGDGGGSAPSQRQLATVAEVVEAAAIRNNQDWADYDTITPDEAAAIRDRSGFNATGYGRVMVASEVHKILRDHGEDPRPITKDDFLRVREWLKTPLTQDWIKRSGRIDVLKSLVRDAGGNVVLVEEIRTGRRKLALLSMYRP